MSSLGRWDINLPWDLYEGTHQKEDMVACVCWQLCHQEGHLRLNGLLKCELAILKPWLPGHQFVIVLIDRVGCRVANIQKVEAVSVSMVGVDA